MYSVTVGDTSKSFDSRAHATDAAKELSSERHDTVIVSDEAENLRMVYRRGQLESFNMETRRRN